MGAALPAVDVGRRLLAAYRDLVSAETRVADALARASLPPLASTLMDAWPVLHDFLDLYVRGMAPCGALVLAGGPDEGSRSTGIPFTGPRRARESLALDAPGDAESPAGKAFWNAVTLARERLDDAPLESLFAAAHVAHARPLDGSPDARPVIEASVRHVTRLLSEARPQLVVTVGTEPLRLLARATGDATAREVGLLGEDAWLTRWPPGAKLRDLPWLDVPLARPMRARLAPLPALYGRHSGPASEALAALLRLAWTG